MTLIWRREYCQRYISICQQFCTKHGTIELRAELKGKTMSNTIYQVIYFLPNDCTSMATFQLNWSKIYSVLTFKTSKGEAHRSRCAHAYIPEITPRISGQKQITKEGANLPWFVILGKSSTTKSTSKAYVQNVMFVYSHLHFSAFWLGTSEGGYWTRQGRCRSWGEYGQLVIQLNCKIWLICLICLVSLLIAAKVKKRQNACIHFLNGHPS